MQQWNGVWQLSSFTHFFAKGRLSVRTENPQIAKEVMEAIVTEACFGDAGNAAFRDRVRITTVNDPSEAEAALS